MSRVARCWKNEGEPRSIAALRWRSCAASVGLVCSQPIRRPPQKIFDSPPIVMTARVWTESRERRALYAVEREVRHDAVVDDGGATLVGGGNKTQRVLRFERRARGVLERAEVGDLRPRGAKQLGRRGDVEAASVPSAARAGASRTR